MQFTARPELRGTFGAVASSHWIATSVGMRILELGGNACDAAVATGFALQVVAPLAVAPQTAPTVCPNQGTNLINSRPTVRAA